MPPQNEQQSGEYTKGEISYTSSREQIISHIRTKRKKILLDNPYFGSRFTQIEIARLRESSSRWIDHYILNKKVSSPAPRAGSPVDEFSERDTMYLLDALIRSRYINRVKPRRLNEIFDFLTPEERDILLVRGLVEINENGYLIQGSLRQLYDETFPEMLFKKREAAPVKRKSLPPALKSHPKQRTSPNTATQRQEWDGDSAFKAYLDDISQSTPLSREREIELSLRIKEGDLKARDELAKANLRFVVSVAMEYQNRGLPLTELISAGNLGLLTAAERFDGERGFKFISYAVHWIRQSILQTLAEQSRTVRLPVSRIDLLHNILKKSEQSEGKSLEEVADELNIPVAEVVDTLVASRKPISLDDSAFNDNDASWHNFLGREGTQTEELLQKELREGLDHAIKTLDPRQQEILRLYFGLDGNGRMTLDQIGARLGVTRERTRQIKEKALAKLRHPCRSEILEEYTK